MFRLGTRVSRRFKLTSKGGCTTDWSKKREHGLPAHEVMAYPHKPFRAAPDVQQFINVEATNTTNTKPFPSQKTK